jgi:hypothetical protein
VPADGFRSSVARATNGIIGRVWHHPFSGMDPSHDLKQRVGFFDLKPCPIKTLILFRADGTDALKSDTTRSIHDAAIQSGRDVRIHKFEPNHLHALMAFGPWYQAALAEIEDAKVHNSQAETVFQDVLAGISKELLGWVEAWQLPASQQKGAIA